MAEITARGCNKDHQLAEKPEMQKKREKTRCVIFFVSVCCLSSKSYACFFSNKIIQMTLIETHQQRLLKDSTKKISEVQIVQSLYFNMLSSYFQNLVII